MASCLPGDVLGRVSEGLAPGPGTHVREGLIRASLCGRPLTQGGEVRVAQASRSLASASALVPEVGQLVLARVLRIAPLLAHCELLLCEGRPTAPYSGVVRREHIREGEVDALRMEECFVPGDIVQAVVASLGDARSPHGRPACAVGRLSFAGRMIFVEPDGAHVLQLLGATASGRA